MPRKTVTRLGSCHSEPVAPEFERGFDPNLLNKMQDLAAAGLTPTCALELIKLLIEEVPSASKEGMERLKMLDKLINTARAMMETRLKTQEAAEIAARLDEIELRIEALATQGPAPSPAPSEIWNARDPQ
jgi:hypothetical protein